MISPDLVPQNNLAQDLLEFPIDNGYAQDSPPYVELKAKKNSFSFKNSILEI
jgi:hypothetical protein